MSLFRKYTYNYTNNEIDYSKVTDAIINAKVIEENKAKEKIEKETQIIVTNRLENLRVQDCFDEDGKIKNMKSFFKFCWNFMRAKEDSLKGISLLSEVINGLVASFFWIIEWLLYIISVSFISLGAFKYIDGCIFNDIAFSIFNFYKFLGNVIYGILLFVLSRMIVRLLKIECLNNKDFNYMLNFLAVIIAVIAIIISVVFEVR